MKNDPFLNVATDDAKRLSTHHFLNRSWVPLLSIGTMLLVACSNNGGSTTDTDKGNDGDTGSGNANDTDSITGTDSVTNDAKDSDLGESDSDDVSTGSACLDGIVNGTEDCEPGDLNGETCVTRGFDSGVLACSDTCTFDTTNCSGTATIDTDIVTYAGPGARTRFNAIHPLSDGTLLIGGQTNSLNWIPDGVPVTEIATSAYSHSSGNIGFILQLSASGRDILRVVHFPADSVRDVFRIRSTEVFGAHTGVIYISGSRDGVGISDDGYYVARLDGNFVDAVPTGVDWSNDIQCKPRQAGGYEGESDYKKLQPWDVDSNGRVIYGRGAEYDFAWAQMGVFDADGTDGIIEHWTAHWTDADDDGNADGEFYGAASEATDTVLRSGVVLKAGRRGSLRSLTQLLYDELNPDGNGRTDRPGHFPDDYFFSGPCLVNGDCAGSPGYTGYSTSSKPTQRLGGVAIDRRNNWIYFGYSTQSVLPGGNPDFEPAVVAMDETGKLRWWNRLYNETDQNSSPDQYVDGVTVDYVNNRILFLARAHGNNTYNLWKGNDIAANASASAFQNQFTGTNGNIHISWLGAFTLNDGTLLASTYIAELNEGLGGGVSQFGESRPLLTGQPNPNSGWADLNTTRCRNSVSVDRSGNVWVACTGRRTITTSNGYQQMEPVDGGAGTWNDFVRGYTPDLSDLVYATLLTGEWDRTDGTGGGNTTIESIAPVDGGILSVGWHHEDDTGTAKGERIITTSVPAWGTAAPSGETAIFSHFSVD